MNSEDLRVYEAILSGFERIDELSSALGKKENSVYRSIQRLLLAGLIYREKRVLPAGGYYFVYKAVPKEFVAKEIETAMNIFCEKVRNFLRDFLADRGTRL
ncbi:MAG: TrmB family transcriptional regulator [Archaeoglobales archaeon]|nr:TrmB family transcriptional regulator [Archaeoglobales archaeon]